MIKKTNFLVYITQCKKNVISNKANIGFAFDGDGDRLIVVDEKGNLIDGDKILALFAKYLMNRNLIKSNNIVVSTVMSNLGFENFLKNERENPSYIIEIHNRPNYFHLIQKLKTIFDIL